MGLMIKTIIELHAIALVAGFFLDLIIGDPHWLYHPVRLIGLLISLCEKIFLGKSDKAESDSKGGKNILRSFNRNHSSFCNFDNNRCNSILVILFKQIFRPCNRSNSYILHTCYKEPPIRKYESV